MIYVIGDTHFNHENIIEYCDRPFYNVFEMNETIVVNWNSVVTDQDTVLHVGDLRFGNSNIDYDIISGLKGYKVLVMGNHDRSSASAYRKLGFNEVHKKKNLYIGNFIFSHRPIKSSMPYDKINVHGHVHNAKWFRYDYFHFNVSCEAINYKPIALDEIKRISKTNELIEVYEGEVCDVC